MRTTIGLVLLLAACGGGGGVTGDLATPADLAMAPVDMAAAVVTSIAVTTSTPKVLIGDQPTFTATATYSDATMKDVSASATWASSMTSIATIAAGVATGVAPGSTMITAQLGGLTSAPVSLAVREVEGMAVTGPGGISNPGVMVGNPAGVQLVATATLSDADSLDVTKDPRTMWSSSDTTIIPVVTGGLAIPANNNGTSAITAKFATRMGMVTVLVHP